MSYLKSCLDSDFLTCIVIWRRMRLLFLNIFFILEDFRDSIEFSSATWLQKIWKFPLMSHTRFWHREDTHFIILSILSNFPVLEHFCYIVVNRHLKKWRETRSNNLIVRESCKIYCVYLHKYRVQKTLRININMYF